MSILKTIYLQHLNGAAPNATLDANGNMTITGTIVSSSPTGGMRNRIINGDMRIDQRTAGTNSTVSAATATYPSVDRFRFDNQCDAVLTVRQVNSANTSASNYEANSTPAGFINSMKITVATADSSLTSGQYSQFQQFIEGLNVADLDFGKASSKTVTLSFWVKSSITGSYSFALANLSGNRAYPATYTINSANTWEYKTITIPGDVTGTWITNNSAGFLLEWFLGFWTGYAGSSTGWNAGTQFVTTGTTQFVNTLNATLYITGVQLEVGSVATPFEFRQYTTELSLCHRYFYYTASPIYGYNGSGATITSSAHHFWPVPMRASPTVVVGTGAILVSNITGAVTYQSSIASGASYNPSTISASAEL